MPAIKPAILKCSATNERLLLRLGMAAKLQWDQVPKALQDLLLDQACSLLETDLSKASVQSRDQMLMLLCKEQGSLDV
jgi:hypothetical protein